MKSKFYSKFFFLLLLLSINSCHDDFEPSFPDDQLAIDLNPIFINDSNLNLILEDLNTKIKEYDNIMIGKGRMSFEKKYGKIFSRFARPVDENQTIILFPLIDEKEKITNWMISKYGDFQYEYFIYHLNSNWLSTIEINKFPQFEIKKEEFTYKNEKDMNRPLSLSSKLFMNCTTTYYTWCIYSNDELVGCDSSSTKTCYISEEYEPLEEEISAPEEGLGGGSGGTNPFASLKDPCKDMEALGKDLNMVSTLKDLQQKTGENKEYGRLVKKVNDSYNFSDYLVGLPGSGEINFTVVDDIDGVMHTHYSGLLSIFSPADIRSIYDIYRAGKMSNWREYMSMLVTANGTTYTLMIDDMTKFKALADRYFQNEDSFFGFEAIFSLSINESQSNYNNEISFLNFIKGTGLKLFKGNPVSFDTWSGITTNDSGNGIISDCN